MKILVTGANGQLGQELINLKSNHRIMGLTRTQLDITDAEQVRTAIKALAPDLIINAAAYTQVDKAEQELKLAFAINRDGAGNVARGCAEKNIPLIHLSTDYVFSGEQAVPYREEDATGPINVYGQSKLVGEQAVQQLLDNGIILRVSSVFSFYGNNFVKTILRLAREREQLRIVADNTISPTSAYDIAEALLKIVDAINNNAQNNYAGIYHFCSHDPASWYQFAEEIIQQAAHYENLKVKELEAITSAEYPTPAKRPAYSVLNTTKLQQTFSVRIPSWRDGLTKILTRIYQ